MEEITVNAQKIKTAEIIRPHFTEEQARESLEKPKRFSLGKKNVRWVSSIPLYLPFWLVQVEMDLRDPSPKQKGRVSKIYTIMVNAMNNRGLTLKGELHTDLLETQGIFLDQEAEHEEVRETARLEALAGSKRMINPPPHRVLKKMQLVYYPLGLVRLEVNGKEEVQVFDFYRGGLDKYMMRYLNLKEKMEAEGRLEKKKA